MAFDIRWVAKSAVYSGRMPIAALPASGSIMCTLFDGQQCLDVDTGESRWIDSSKLDWSYDAAESTHDTTRRTYFDGRDETLDARTGIVLSRTGAEDALVDTVFASHRATDLDALYAKLPALFNIWLDGWREDHVVWQGAQNAELCVRANGTHLLLIVMRDKSLVAIDVLTREAKTIYAGVYWVPRQLNARAAIGLDVHCTACLALDLDTLTVSELHSTGLKWVPFIALDPTRNVACIGTYAGDVWGVKILL